MILYDLRRISPELRRELCSRPWRPDETSLANARRICRDVQEGGDAALRRYTEEFDSVAVDDFRVPAEELSAARGALSRELQAALETAARNIRLFHKLQAYAVRKVETMPGVVCWREARPIERIGLYVPAGTAPLPSTVLMLGIPALVAQCERIILCSPPQRDGKVHPAVLAAADLIGLREVYRAGGAQAIAAMAYGTESVPRVEKIFGPGNRYVTAAKQIVSTDPGGPAIDLLAGPSELLVIADDGADPRFVAADLLSQAEHDPHSQVVLVTPAPALAEKVSELLAAMINLLPRRDVAARSLDRSFTLMTGSLEEAVQFSNEYAPEHLILNVRSPEHVCPKIRNAGSVFLGPFAPVTAGDYASGTNHTLPTGGTARLTGGVTLESFQKPVTFQSISREGLQRLAPTLTALAAAEGLEAHKNAVTIRLGNV